MNTPPRITTIQRTSKPIKLIGGLAKLGLIASFAIAIFGEGGWRAVGAIGILLFTLAVIFTRWVRAWCHD